MKLNLLVYTSALSDASGSCLGVGTVAQLASLAKAMNQAGIAGDIYDLPNGSRAPHMASPFSLSNGFALNSDEIDLSAIPEVHSDETAHRLWHKLDAAYRAACGSASAIDYTLRRTVSPLLLEACFHAFEHQAASARQQAFAEFKRQAAYWLDHFALFTLYRESGVDLTEADWRDTRSERCRAFCRDHQRQLEYLRYVQFLCYEQRRSLLEVLQASGIGLIVNMPFGVDPNSADVYFNPEVFDGRWQIGCGPEPENGFPEQVWGLAAYHECSAALECYLQQKMRWLAQLGSGVFFDHMVGWCGQYLIPAGVSGHPAQVFGHFPCEDAGQRSDKLRWFIDLVLREGLAIRGEVFGDRERLAVTVQVMQDYAQLGADVSVMHLPWKTNTAGQCRPLDEYGAQDLLAWGTHDLETPLQYICARRGDLAQHDDLDGVRAFCRDVLALPLGPGDLPLDPARLSTAAVQELARRMVQGTAAGNVLFTWPGLASLLSAEHRSCATAYNINVTPGTSGEVGNRQGNWSMRSPDVDLLSTDSSLHSFLNQYGRRQYRPFASFRPLQLEASHGMIQAHAAAVTGRQILHCNAESNWDILNSVAPVTSEVLLHNTGAAASCRLDLHSLLQTDEGNNAHAYHLLDARDGQSIGRWTCAQLAAGPVELQLAAAEYRHLLLIAAESNIKGALL